MKTLDWPEVSPHTSGCVMYAIWYPKDSIGPEHLLQLVCACTLRRPKSTRRARLRTRGHPPINGWRHTFSSLANFDFLRLWLSMVLLWGGFHMQSVARGLLVYDITESSTILGLVSAGGQLPLRPDVFRKRFPDGRWRRRPHG